MNYSWCEYYGYEPNDNLEMVFNFEAKEYIKKCIRKNEKRFGKNYTQEDSILDEQLQDIKKELFGK